ncbi:MAG: FtsX-like permease family protein [Ruminococcus sp.]|nr:FtsX-like permease family protein [Ruminococcus sp.]
MPKNKKKHSSMSFLTALGLSANNLRTKKGRTIMTSFAGSIGIIGIALILALSSGVNEYIQSIEEDTLSEYPLQITNSEFDLTSLMAAMSSTVGNSGSDDAEISVTEIVSTLFSEMNSNDLASLKEYIDSGESDLESYSTAVEYIYDLEPEIYLESDDSVRKVNPDTTLSSASGNSMLTAMMSSYGITSFYAMPDSEALYKNKYEVKAGRWPKNYNECVLVLTSDGSISDYMLYALGLRDYSELEAILNNYLNEESTTSYQNSDSYSYEDVLGTTYKVVCAADYYAYDSEYDVWVDKTENADYLNELVENGEDLTIVGVVQPTEDSASTLSTGINYSSSLITHMAELSAKSDVVKAQLATPDVNIFTGEAFGESDNSFSPDSLFSLDEEALAELFDFDSLSIDSSELDMSSLSIDTDSLLSGLDTADLSIDTDFLEDYLSDYEIDTSSLDLSEMDSISIDLSELDLSGVLDSITADISEDAVSTLLNNLLAGYQSYSETVGISYTDLSEDFSNYLQSDEAQQIIVDFLSSHISVGDFSVSSEGLSDAIASVIPEDEEITSADIEEVTAAVTAYINENAEISVNISDEDLATLSSTLVSGYSASATIDLNAISESFSDYLSSDAAMQILSDGLAEMLDWDSLQSQLNSAVESYLQEMMSAVVSSYIDAVEAQLLSLTEQMQAELTSALTTEISTQLNSIMESSVDDLMSQISEQLSTEMESLFESSISNLLTADSSSILEAFGLEMDADELSELLLSMSNSVSTDYERNLETLGYIDFDTPTEIDIYPIDFEAKDSIVEILDDYNNQMEESGETEKVITYTDLVGTMMSSVTTIINVITYVLIAFVAISLVVSCIMISIITQISVMERTKEIGILRAIGASKRNISEVFNAETFIIGISSGLIGVVISKLLIIPINVLIHWLAGSTNVNAVLPWSYAFILVIISVVITVLSGLLPARKAAKMNPVTALRTE